jgi:hypothetical protein
MGRWLNQLRKNSETAPSGTDKTDKTLSKEVSSVLSVRPSGVFKNFASAKPDALGGSVSFVSSSSEQIPNFDHLSDRSGWDEEDWQAAFDERAGILEYDAGMSRADAEALAMEEVERQRAEDHRRRKLQ